MISKDKTKNKVSWYDRFPGLRGLQKNIFLRAALVLLALVLVVVLLFSVTAAWYTNVVQSGGLSFKAESWNFDGEVTISTHEISAAPGDEGIVALSLKNNSDHTIAASVSVSKREMSEEMQRRLYFYVDIPDTRNSEKMKRVWVSANSSYTYLVFPNSEMNLNEDFTKGPLLKWMWTYDVLGYYVRGTQNGSNVIIDEYIRPIEYNYDPAKTTFQGNGKLATIDGKTTVSEFLKELTETDGYPGVIDDTVTSVGNGYYPVDVDEDGCGIWIYLCTYSDIQQNQSYDAALAEDKDKVESCPANITVTGWNSNDSGQTVTVSSEDEFKSMLSSSYSPVVKLSSDMTLTQRITMAEGKSVLIDLNGYTLTTTMNQYAFHVTEGVSLVMQNGTFKGSGLDDKQLAIVSRGGHITLNNVNLEGFGGSAAIRIDDDLSKTNEGSVVRITDCTFKNNYCGCGVYGVSQPGKTTSVVIERSYIEGSYMGLYGQGSAWGTDIQVIDSTVIGGKIGVYHPERDSVLTLTRCTVIGEDGNGINVKGGTVNIIDCKVSGLGPAMDPGYYDGGSTLTGDGVYLEAGYDWMSTIVISGDDTEITSQNAQAVRKYKADAAKASIIISAGSYSTDVSDYLSEGAEMTESDDGWYVVKTGS